MISSRAVFIRDWSGESDSRAFEAEASETRACCIAATSSARLRPLVQVLREGKSRAKPREELLRELAALEGVYVPEFYSVAYRPEGTIESRTPRENAPPRVKRVWLRNLNDTLTASSVLTPQTELSDMLLLELSRGCRRRCRFCASCYTYFPHRVREDGHGSEPGLEEPDVPRRDDVAVTPGRGERVASAEGVEVLRHPPDHVECIRRNIGDTPIPGGCLIAP